MSWRRLLLCSGFGILICSLPTPLLRRSRVLYGSANDRACQVCHPGATADLRSSAHGALLADPVTAEQACTVCHGDLTEHRASARRQEGEIASAPPVQATACDACHLERDWPVSFGAHPRNRTGPGTETPPVSMIPQQDSGFDWSGLWTLGYRFVSRGGSAARYRQDVNLDPGLRLLQAEVEAAGKGDAWADQIRLSMDGLDDPYTDLRFDISKALSYDASARFSESEVIYEATGDFHHVDRNTKRGGIDLSVDLSEELQLFGSYGRLDTDSLWLVNRIGDQGLTPLTTVDDVTSPRQLQSDLAEVGVGFSAGATAGTLAFDYLDESSTDRWLYMRPAQADPGFVESEDFTSDSTLRGPGGRATLSTRAGDWSFDLTGRYTDLDRRTNGMGSTTGFNFDEYTVDTRSTSDGHARTWLLDGSATWELSDQAALVFDVRWLDHKERMDIDQANTTTFPNLGIVFTDNLVLDNDTDQQKLTASAQMDYSPQPGLDLSLGYAWSREYLKVPDLEPTDTDFVSGTIRDHGVIGGVRWRPDEHWTLRASVEDLRQTGAEVHDLSGNDARGLDASLAYQDPEWRIETFAKYRRADNDISDYKLDYDAYGLNGNVHREEGLDLFASYVYSELNSRTLTNFYFDPDPNPVPTFVGFEGTTHTLAAGLQVEPAADVRWQVDLSYTTTSGSFDVTLLDWRADLTFTVWKGGELGVLFRNVDYRDANSVDDYDADIILLYWRQIIGAR